MTTAANVGQPSIPLLAGAAFATSFLPSPSSSSHLSTWEESRNSPTKGVGDLGAQHLGCLVLLMESMQDTSPASLNGRGTWTRVGSSEDGVGAAQPPCSIPVVCAPAQHGDTTWKTEGAQPVPTHREHLNVENAFPLSFKRCSAGSWGVAHRDAPGQTSQRRASRKGLEGSGALEPVG